MPQPTLFSFFQRTKPKDSPESSSTPASKKADESANGNGAVNKPINGQNGIETTPKIKKKGGLNGRTGGASAKRPKPSDSNPKSASAKKFKRIRMDDSDSGDGEAKPPKNGVGDVEDDDGRDVSPDESDDDDFKPGNEESSDDDMEQDCVPSDVESPVKATPKRSKPARRDLRQTMSGWSASPGSATGSPAAATGTTGDSPRTPSTPACRSATKLKLSGFAAECEGASPSAAAADAASSAQDWPHLKLDWLKPERIRDAEGHRPDHPEYNPCTLRVSTEFLDKQTPAIRQWWLLKSSHFDCVLFFKMGKFYEMFHMDAVLCVKELGLLFMKGEHAHVGFPETSFSRYSSALVEKGHRVCRIEQTETPDMMQRRVSQAKRVTKFDRVVAREICQVTSLGTRTFSAVEGDCNEAEFNYLLAIREQELDGAGVQFGVCFVDTSVGEFFLGQFADDCHCSRLRTLLAHHPPVQLLLARTGSSQRCRDVTGGAASCVTDTLRPGHDFWTAEKTLKYLADVDCFSERSANIGGDTCAIDGASSGQSAAVWPQLLVDMTSENDALHQSARADCDLALQSLGAVIWYLKRCLLDIQLLSMKRFSRYCPPDLESNSSSITAGDVPSSAVDGSTTGGGSNGTVSVSETPAAPRTVSDMNAVKVDEQPLPKRMVLDGSTLKNLEIVSNMVDGGTECTLLGTLDTCVTAFGKRLLRAWLCGPLTSISSINARLDAIGQLIRRADVIEQLTAQLKPMPDMDRQLRRIHVQGNARLGDATHPDSRAIMFEEAKYSRAKIGDFLSALSGFQLAQQLIEAGQAEDMTSSSYLLKCCLTFENAGGKFPDLSEALRYFQEAFDHDQARKEGKVVPRPGVDVQYDNALQTLEQVKLEADQYLREQCRRFGCKVVYFGSGRNGYQLEMPDAAAKRTDQSYELQSQKKGAKRYWTDVTRDLLSRRQSADDALGSALRDVSRRLFASFDRYSCSWQRAVECLALLDALLALARYSRSAEPMCRPQLVAAAAGGPSSEQQRHQSAVLELVSCHHPWLGRAGSADFIPNDLTMCRSLLLLTGPNMGGKSTLMRQVGLVIVLAQLGCFVPAESVRLTPFDRIFTRLGAQDHIMSGQSTFHVELSEAASILRHATHRSLVLVDELGRGTSTFDGSAIASAVLRQLLRCACLSLFSTHYHTLVDELQTHSQVWLGHMSCMVENENADDPTQESITFLYKLVEGACPKSYGFNAAQLAGLPTNVIRNAHQMAVRFQKRVETIARFTALWKRLASAMVATK